MVELLRFMVRLLKPYLLVDTTNHPVKMALAIIDMFLAASIAHEARHVFHHAHHTHTHTHTHMRTHTSCWILSTTRSR